MVISKTYTIPGDIEFFSTDSGAPPGSADYTTLVLFHGTAFHGSCFKQLHEHAHALNMRTVVVNRRDYPGSTTFSSLEIDDMIRGRKEFVHRMGVEVGELVKVIIEREHIPRMSPSADGNQMKGGIAIVGWSLGCIAAMSLFAASDLFSSDLYTFLETYIRDLVLYEAAFSCFGYELPCDYPHYNPFIDPCNQTPEDVQRAFAFWVSSYYNHRNLNSRATICDLDGLHKSTGEVTIAKWSEEEVKEYIDLAAGNRELPMLAPPIQKPLRILSEQALFAKESVQAWFPKVKVTYIGGTRTVWICAWAEIEIKRRYERTNGQGRSIKFLDVEGANHFLHMAQPREFLETLATGIGAS